MTSIDVSGRIAVVTGGSRGLGLEMSRGFAAAGASVVVASRKLETCEKVVEELTANGGQASAHAFDAGKWEDCDRLYAEVTERWGGADKLVNNVGKSPIAASSADTSQELFDKIIAINLRSVFRLSALFGAQMRERGRGSIINISSTGSLRPEPFFAPYAAAKSGVNILTETFAKELGPKVRVNTVMPGPFHTDATTAWSRSEEFSRHAEQFLPMGRGGEPSEIVGAVLYLASDLASFTTGACIKVDGGHSIASASGSA
jgi:NAD(P)-dependent dehydrogenase (short-subunit alcohol dehydrogenase family)